jgi:hypothetical protein
MFKYNTEFRLKVNCILFLVNPHVSGEEQIISGNTHISCIKVILELIIMVIQFNYIQFFIVVCCIIAKWPITGTAQNNVMIIIASIQ